MEKKGFGIPMEKGSRRKIDPLFEEKKTRDNRTHDATFLSRYSKLYIVLYYQMIDPA